MDHIFFEKMLFYGYHGAFPEENKLGQRFQVDLKLFLSLQEAGYTDDLTLTVDYGKVYETVQQIVEGTPVKLVEKLAEEIATRLLSEYPIDEVVVRVTKPDPPIPGYYQSVGVEVRRGKR
ncbi:dihydroneopterin aldolase [Croceifilum oryzae]|uniref:7,8-dihydroneopterin aldolase n=1 Tax=Croceifilum oryzae TaxID=1553429 RepID=A0AAJ1TG57_9BACL|nr:dihydroneopterin aldolase [Croceifilum oryzae]MDQ0418263.1 dihydroneopterin aldolase [Croceifilum oryzae]